MKERKTTVAWRREPIQCHPQTLFFFLSSLSLLLRRREGREGKGCG
jgi:hypothetical protein